MHCSLLSLWLEQTHTSSQSTARCCKRLTRGFTFEWKTTCAETTATLTPSHISTPSIHSPAHKGGVMGKRNPTHSARTRAHAIAMSSASNRSKEPCARHKHGGNERDASNSTARPFTSPFPGGLVSHTHSEARRTPSAPLRVHSAGRRPATLVPSQWGAQTIVVSDHRRL
ncbi:hypothetical protein TcG_10927 [Trypanosoma cruzi]|nr:hypothetical protein TcG_10927 [Trypanosoma cruzi]